MQHNIYDQRMTEQRITTRSMALQSSQAQAQASSSLSFLSAQETSFNQNKNKNKNKQKQKQKQAGLLLLPELPVDVWCYILTFLFNNAPTSIRQQRKSVANLTVSETLTPHPDQKYGIDSYFHLYRDGGVSSTAVAVDDHGIGVVQSGLYGEIQQFFQSSETLQKSAARFMQRFPTTYNIDQMLYKPILTLRCLSKTHHLSLAVLKFLKQYVCWLPNCGRMNKSQALDFIHDKLDGTKSLFHVSNATYGVDTNSLVDQCFHVPETFPNINTFTMFHFMNEKEYDRSLIHNICKCCTNLQHLYIKIQCPKEFMDITPDHILDEMIFSPSTCRLLSLSLTNATITTLHGIEQLVHLRFLKLAYCECVVFKTNFPVISLDEEDEQQEQNRTESIPLDISPLSKLQHLQQLDLRHTYILDTAPLTQCKSLQALDISHCFFGPTIYPFPVPVRLQDEFFEQTKQVMRACLTHVGHIPNLQRLFMTCTNSCPEHMMLEVLLQTPLVHTLHVLDISGNGIYGWSYLHQQMRRQGPGLAFMNVMHLKEVETFRQTLATLQHFTKLQCLNMHSIDSFRHGIFSDMPVIDFEPLSSLQHLTVLDVSHIENIDDRNSGFLKHFVRLKSLDVSHTDITDLSFLTNLTQLVSLNLAKIQPRSLEPLKHLKQLTHLNLDGKDESIQIFLTFSQKQLPSLKPLSHLLNLQWLSLRNRKKNVDLCPLLKLSATLWHVNLSGTFVENHLFLFHKMTALRELFVQFTAITQKLVTQFFLKRRHYFIHHQHRHYHDERSDDFDSTQDDCLQSLECRRWKRLVVYGGPCCVSPRRWTIGSMDDRSNVYFGDCWSVSDVSDFTTRT